jgi:hypothetical protein
VGVAASLVLRSHRATLQVCNIGGRTARAAASARRAYGLQRGKVALNQRKESQ